MITNCTILRIDKYTGEDPSTGQPLYGPGQLCGIRCAAVKEAILFSADDQARQLRRPSIGRLTVADDEMPAGQGIDRGDRIQVQPDHHEPRFYVVATAFAYPHETLGYRELSLRDE